MAFGSVLRVVGGDAQSARAVGECVVRVGAGGQQRIQGLQAPLAYRKQERGEATLGHGVQVCTARQQGPGCRRIVLRCGPHERRLPAPTLHRIDIGSMVEQHADRRNHPGPRGRHERRLAVTADAVRIGASLQQQSQHQLAAVCGRQVDRGHPVARRGADLGSLGDQHCGDAVLVQVCGPVQRRRSVGGGGIGIRVLVQQGPDRTRVLRCDRLDERNTRRLRIDEGRRDKPRRGDEQ